MAILVKANNGVDEDAHGTLQTSTMISCSNKKELIDNIIKVINGGENVYRMEISTDSSSRERPFIITVYSYVENIEQYKSKLHEEYLARKARREE